MGGQACSLYRVRVRVCPGLRLKEVFCPPLRWYCVQRTYSVPHFCSRPPDFAPGSSKVAAGSFSLSYLLSRICPTCASTQSFLVPWRFFVFYCLRRAVSRCKHSSIAVNGPRFWAYLKFKPLFKRKDILTHVTTCMMLKDFRLNKGLIMY